MNIPLLIKVRDKIASTPEAYDQETYGRKDDAAPCGTAACIAGWTCVLGGVFSAEEIRDSRTSLDDLVEQIHYRAMELLDIDEAQSEWFFTSDPQGQRKEWDEDDDQPDGGWPQPFASSWANATDRQRPQVAVAYLDWIIENGRLS